VPDPGSDPSDPSDPAPPAEPPSVAPDLGWQQAGEQEPEQGSNRPGTGAPATDPSSLLPPAPAQYKGDSHLQVSTQAPAENSSLPGSVSPCLRVEEAETTTLSVPGIPILLSYRRLPRPFE
jgi:hypothetical protein